MAREMKDSGVEWIGEIPIHWNVRPIKNSFTIVSGSTPDSDKFEYWDGDIPWITPADFKTIDKYTSGGSRFITEKGYNSCSTNMIPKGSIIFSKRAPIGSVVINSVDLCTNQGCLSCIKNEKADSTYFYYVMSIFDDVFNLYGSGTTFKEISATTFGDVILPLPLFLEQKRIASFLDTKCAEIDKAIEATKSSIEEYKKLRQAIISEAVTKGLDPNVEMKDSGVEWIGEIPAHWSNSKIKYVTSLVTDGAHVSPDYVDEGYEFISTVNIKNGYIDFSNCIHTSEKSYLVFVSTGCRPKRGDVLISKDGTVGKTVVIDYDREFVVGSSLVILRPRVDIILQKYLDYSLQAEYIQKQLLLIMHGSALKRVSVQKNANLPIVIPSLDEQRIIVSYLDAKCTEIDTLIKSKEKLIEELTAYRKSLIFEYVTGKKEVPAV